MDRKAPSRLAPRMVVTGLVLLVALGAGHTLLWRSMSAQLEAGWQSWVALRRAQGWQVEHAPPVAAGWPLSATLTLDGLRLEGAEATLPGGLALDAERVVLRVTLPRIDRLHVELPARQRLRLAGVDYPFTATTLRATLPLEPGIPPNGGEVFAERLRIGTPAGDVELRSGQATIQASVSATEAEPAVALAVLAEGLDLPASAGGPFGGRIEALAADLVLTGPLPPGRIPAARAEAWRDGGGTLELRSLALRWGPADATLAATLALDEALQPMGAGTLRLAGAPQTLQALEAAGLVGRRAAATARTVLPLLSRPSPETGQPEIQVPLTLEDRTLALARIPLLRLEPLVWRGAGSPR